jgi:hypothetical protein
MANILTLIRNNKSPNPTAIGGFNGALPTKYNGNNYPSNAGYNSKVIGGIAVTSQAQEDALTAAMLKNYTVLPAGNVFDGTGVKGESISFLLDNSTGVAPKDYYLFGSTNMINANIEGYNAPTSASDGVGGGTITDLIVGGQELTLVSVIMSTNSGLGQTQFMNSLYIAQGGIDRTNNPVALRSVVATSPMNYNPDQLNLIVNYKPGRTSYSYITVVAGCKLMITYNVAFN